MFTNLVVNARNEFFKEISRWKWGILCCKSWCDMHIIQIFFAAKNQVKYTKLPAILEHEFQINRQRKLFWSSTKLKDKNGTYNCIILLIISKKKVLIYSQFVLVHKKIAVKLMINLQLFIRWLEIRLSLSHFLLPSKKFSSYRI